MSILQIQQLEKKFKDKEVVKKLSFEVKEGEVLCLLGPNGAGKSTTINMLCGVLPWDSGNVLFQGKPIFDDLKGYKKVLGVVPQDIALYEDLSAKENIRFFASLYGLKGEELKVKCEKALTFVGLQDRQEDIVGTFSGGMKRRLNIACAIAHEPKIIVMDEPTVGIDPQSRNRILDTVRELQKSGTAIIYSTHYMEEVEEISSRIVIMDEGVLLVEGTKEQLKQQVIDVQEYVLRIEDDVVNLQAFQQLKGIQRVTHEEGCLHFLVDSSEEILREILDELRSQNIQLQHLDVKHGTLETVFLNLTGRNLRDE